MIVGSADIAALSAEAPTIAAYSPDPVSLTEVECFQLTAEMRNSAREAVLPSALHPTVPPALSLQAWNIGSSPWGRFSMALARVSCRSGVRARGFTTRLVASTDEAVAGLAATFGFPAAGGDVALRRHYDGVDVSVVEDGQEILRVSALDPDPMGTDDVQYTGTMNLAHTPNGLRLVQVEAEHVATRVERLTARILSFDPAGWGNGLLDPYHVVSASIALEQVVMPPLRFVCKVDELAFTGTEKITGA